MYQMTVRGIKKIMREELEGKLNLAISQSGLNRDLFNSMKWHLLDELDHLETYEQLDAFCLDYCKMSLAEWVESL